MLNVQMNPRREAGTIVGFSRGSVIRRNFCHGVSPSTSAASYSSGEIPWRPPEKIIIMKGKPSQTFVTMTATRGRGEPGAVNHAHGVLPQPSMPHPKGPRTAVMSPCWVSNLPARGEGRNVGGHGPRKQQEGSVHDPSTDGTI